jgi:hypothetical protein
VALHCPRRCGVARDWPSCSPWTLRDRRGCRIDCGERGRTLDGRWRVSITRSTKQAIPIFPLTHLSSSAPVPRRQS